MTQARLPSRAWITAWCWALILFGAVFAMAGVPALEAPARAAFALLAEPLPAAMEGPTRISVALMGAVTMGWGITVLAVLRTAYAQGIAGAPIWRGVTVALAVWWLIDGALSLAVGYPGNAVSNTVLLVGWLVPVLASGILRRA